MIIGILNKITNPIVEKKALKKTDCLIECLKAKEERDLPDDLSKYNAVILSHSFKLSAYSIEKLINCTAIICSSVGYDNVDFAYARKKGIRVFNVPDYGTNDVADHALALLLSYSRNICIFDKNMKENMISNWNKKTVKQFHRLTNKTVGIIGLGRIGTAFALRVKALGMKVIYYDPYKENGYDKAIQVLKVNSLKEIFLESDIISIHVPLTKETRGMINNEIINYARKKPIIINTSRGKVVVQDDILCALRNNMIDSFLSDVLEEEPPKINLLNDPTIINRIIITPHAASYAEESQYEMRYKAASTAYNALIDKDYVINCINFVRSNYEC